MMLHAVIRISAYERVPPWAVADIPPYSWLRLWGGATEAEVGRIVYELVAYNHLEGSHTSSELLQRITQESDLVLNGGLQARGKNGEAINPGCCCGLEDWRDWEKFLATGCAPWLGHDPTPWMEKCDEGLRIWANKGDEDHINFALDELVGGISYAQNDLIDFLGNLKEWAQKNHADLAQKLVEKFDQCFSIHQPG
jgi:hypothetical protein